MIAPHAEPNAISAVDQERRKRKAAERAVEFVESGMLLGLGTGSTARHVLDVIAERLASASLRNIRGVPTSNATAAYAQQLGIPLVELDDVRRLDLAIDGADEVDPRLDLIKGLGGALLREKIVESAADRLIVVVDDSKLVARLGEKAPVPVEVVPFGWRTTLERLREAGAEPTLRTTGDGSPFVSDGGHYIVDCAFPGGMDDAVAVQRALRAPAGVVETGLFLDMATAVVVAGDDVRTLTRTTP